MDNSRPKDDGSFNTEKPAGSGAAKGGAKPPVSVPMEKPAYPGMPEVTKERVPNSKR